MFKTMTILIMLFCSSQVFAQDFLWKAVYDPPETKMDWFKESVKVASYGAGLADAWTTATAINNNAHENNPIANFFIDKQTPAPAARIALSLGANYGANILYDYLYKKFNNKYYRLLFSGLRLIGTYYQTRFAIQNYHNSTVASF
jgi:hypothetical protein